MSRLVVAIGHVEFTGSSQVLYVVNVQQDVDEWQVRRTYSDFRKLRDDVQRVMKDDARTQVLDDDSSRTFARELQDVAFPSKRLFGSKKDHVVKERAVELHRFLMKLLFLTHTYRKAQKERCDQYVQALPADQQVAFAALQDRTQASITVFYLLRDFLKPVTIEMDHGGLSQSRDGQLNAMGRLSRGLRRREGDDGSETIQTSRLIRESKILAMRSSTNSNKTSTSRVSMSNGQQQKPQVEELCEESHTDMELKNAPGNRALDRLDAVSQSERGISSTTCRNSATKKDVMAASERSRADVNTLLRGQGSQKPPSASAVARESWKQQQYPASDGNVDGWKNYAAHAAASIPSSAGSSVHDEPEPETERTTTASSSMPFSVSGATFVDGERYKGSSSSFLCNTNKYSRRGGDVFNSFQESRSKDMSFVMHSKEIMSSSRTKRKALSIKSIQMTDSERMSRVSSALNAQAISIHAQRELEKYLSEYSAIMILRYVDRFINKAVMKAPGCYSVDAQYRLVIDSQRFLEELEITFSDLPNNFGEMFHIRAPDEQSEWGFPPALDKYVQLKWDSFQAMNSSSSLVSLDTGHSSAADHTSDSDDSDTEYEYEEVGGGSGYMKAKHTFSNDEESMLQEMIDNGTAGREQMLRLRRQTHEQGWNRRDNPGSRSQRVIEKGSSSESEEGETKTRQREKCKMKRRDPTRSGPCEVEKYQQEQNARRKDRLSRVQSIGGFV
uniref:PX domain-containing protein n=1 Tax=Hyaloperonospora arabidopsidis (strain Emoy2) TaxID=559515 RepID=M4B525_HYAAE